MTTAPAFPLALAARDTFNSACSTYAHNGCSRWETSAASLALSGIYLIAHIALAIKYKHALSTVLIIGCLFETLGYALKLASNFTWTYYGRRVKGNVDIFVVWMILIMTAPFFINAYIHTTLSRLHHHFLPNTSLLSIGHLLLPVLPFFDILPFILQTFGLLMVYGYIGDGNYSTVLVGSKLLFASSILQLVPLLIFFATLASFTHKANKVRRSGGIVITKDSSAYKGLTTALFWVITALVIRVSFYAYNSGTDEFWLPSNSRYPASWMFKYFEPFFIAFDSVPILVCLISLAGAHPGRFLRKMDARPRSLGGRWGAWKQWRGARNGEQYRLDAEAGMQNEVRRDPRGFVA